MDKFINLNTAPILVAVIFGILCLTLVLAFFFINRKRKESSADFLEQLKYVSGDYNKKEDNNNKGIVNKWNNYWGKRLIQAEMVSSSKSKEQAGQLILLIFIVIYALTSIALRNPGIGLVPLMIIIPILNMKIEGKIQAKQRRFNEQIPGFLSTLKSNVQAGETPENALISAIEVTDDPLRSELYIAKDLTETGSFQIAISTLRERTQDETIKFLCGCIELSSKVGANLESQIETIEGILESKEQLRRKLDVAIAENTPLLYVSMVLTPGLFIIMYLSNETTRLFWFKSLISWIVFFGIIAVYGLGVFLSNRMIKKTGDFSE